MTLAIPLIRILLAGIFGVAGVTKLIDPAGSRKALEEFGVPSALVPLLSIALPVAEIVISVSLLFGSLSWYGAIGALVLLALFSAGMAVQISKGNAPDCHCFGQLSSEPVSPRSLIRNLIFAVPAVILVILGPGAQGASIHMIDTQIIQVIAIMIGVALIAMAVLYLKNISDQQTQILRRIELIELISREGAEVEREHAGSPHDGLPIGAILPDLQLQDLDGKAVSTADVVTGRPTLFFFVSPSCNPCKALVPQFDEWQETLSDRLDLVFISSGSAKENAEKFNSGVAKRILLQKEREFAESVHARWTPSALFVNGKGKVSSHIAAGDSAIAEIVDKIIASDLDHGASYITLGRRDESNSEIGKPIPEFEAKTLDGHTISNDDLMGQPTLVTFFSPTCPHCVDMLDEFRNWEDGIDGSGPKVLIISSGEVEANREMGFKAPLILDDDSELAGQFGLEGTPSAILIDEEGNFASEIAVGSKNIWSLVGKGRS